VEHTITLSLPVTLIKALEVRSHNWQMTLNWVGVLITQDIRKIIKINI
jgi:hypothetical protein